MVDWKKVEKGLCAAERLPLTERAEFLESYCSGDFRLHSEINSLLSHAANADGFLEHSYGAHAAALLDSDNSGRTFGNYQIVREIGHGGMGAVYLARRTDGEFDQEVALKIVRGSVADNRMLERFRQERQILASLNHPNIAKLLDGGVSAAGEPFLAMEYVEGETITDFVRNTNPSIDATLQLFVKVCSAVSYAHRNLVVHRDIKPGNILVTANGEPKLLDFGLAKLAEDDLSINQNQTETMFRALTPAYASPEQFLGQPITTASDIYSLGVLLFELLTGERPFQFEKKPLDQIIATITSHSPPLPSSVRGPSSDDRSTKVDPRSKLQRSLKGDLDTIILMALRKEPERRYQSVETLADDIERHLKGLPVSARGNTSKYRAAKFVKRHKVGVLAAGLILISLVGGISVSLWQARQAGREKAKAEAVNAFMQTMLNASSPDNGMQTAGRALTVKDVLDEASKRLAGEDLSSQPEVRAELQKIIGTSYYSLGQYNLAEKNLNAALETQTRIYGADHLETLQTMVILGGLLVGRGDRSRAGEFYSRSLPILRSAAKSGTIQADYVLTTFCDFAILRRAEGDSKEAEKLLRDSLDIVARMTGVSRVLLDNTRVVLGLTLSDQGKFAEAIEYVRSDPESSAGKEGDLPVQKGVKLIFLGRFQMESGSLVEAEKNLRAGEAIYRQIFNESKLELGDVLRLVAETLYLENKYPEAEEKINEALKIYRAGTTARHINYPTALRVQAMIYSRTDRIDAAEKLLREAVSIRSEYMPETNFMRALDEGALGEFLSNQRRFDEAEPILLKCLESLTASQEPDSPRIRTARVRLFDLYSRSGKKVVAEKYAD